MNEIRDLIVGIDFGKENSQICYYDRKAGEPRSVSMKVGTSQYEAPTCLCRRTDQEEYCVGLEAMYFAREKGGIMVDGLYEVCRKRESVSVGGIQTEPWELLAHFLKGMLRFLGIADIVRNIRGLIVTMPQLDHVQVANFQKAFESLGFEHEKCFLMDYGESFFYYALTQKRENWNRSVGWYAFAPDGVTFCKLTMNSSQKPTLVKLSDPVSAKLSEEGEIRDLEFCRFIKETLGNEPFSSIQITGEGFSQEWSVQSVKMLCYQKRRVFYGNNLFAKGACAAGKEKLEDRFLKGYRYLSSSLVLADVGMEMRVMGSPVYHPFIEAGCNWYECRAKCELILDNTEELVFVVSTFDRPEKRRVGMMLPGIPQRPNKTTRLSLELCYISRTECQITVRDLGFGDLFPSSGKEWKETVEW